MAQAAELDHPSSTLVGFPDYFSAEAPQLAVQRSLGISKDFNNSNIRELRTNMCKALADAALADKLDKMSDTASWLVEEVAAEAASNGMREDRRLLDVGYGVTTDGRFVEFFSDSDPRWGKDSGRENHGRGLRLLKEAGVVISCIQHTDEKGEPTDKTLFFTIDPEAEAKESETVLFDFDSIKPI
jgi:hypothetical protein